MVTFNNFIYLFEICDLPAFFILADSYGGNKIYQKVEFW